MSTDMERSIELNGVTAGGVDLSGEGRRREYVAMIIDVSKKLAQFVNSWSNGMSTIVSQSNRSLHALAIAAGVFNIISATELFFSYAGRCEQPFHCC